MSKISKATTLTYIGKFRPFVFRINGEKIAYVHSNKVGSYSDPGFSIYFVHEEISTEEYSVQIANTTYESPVTLTKFPGRL